MKKSLALLALFCVAVFAQGEAPPVAVPVLVPVAEPEPASAVEPEPAPAVMPEPAPVPAPVAAPVIPVPVAALAKMSVAQALGASSLPRVCLADFTALFEGHGFSMGKFVKELPPAVAKVKVQMKSPFGKPKDGDRTNVGLTVGCIKALPESPAEIQGLLKDVALKAGLDFAMDAANNYSIPSGVEEKEGSGGGTLKTVVSASLIGGGLGALVYGFLQNSDVSNSVKDKDGKAAVRARDSRNMGYGVGAALLAGGLGVVIIF